MEAKETNIEKNIADNIKALRLQSGLKQSELGELVAYSDKTVSKWENGSSVPDITALCALAEVFHVTVDDLTKENASDKFISLTSKEAKENRSNEIAMVCLSVLTVYMIAVFVYVALRILRNINFWQIFIWAICPSSIIVYRFNRYNTAIKWLDTLTLTIFLWTLLTAIYLQMIEYNLWPLFFLGAPLQAMIVIYTLFTKHKPVEKKKGSKKKFRIKITKGEDSDSAEAAE